jgi:threonine-phosphate decarboxylase
MAIAHQHGGDVFAVARSLGIPPEEILDFSASINPLGMAPGLADALTACFGRLLHYPDKGAAELRERLAAYHGVSCGHIAVANGSTELIHLIPRLCAVGAPPPARASAAGAAGKRGLIVAPAFAEYAFALQRAGWEIDYFTVKSSDGFQLSLPAFADKLREGYDLVFICNPANPTGALIPKDDIEAIIALCQQSGTFLVLDEAFVDFCEDESAKDLIVRYPRAVLLRSMTKFFAIPGLRLGYAIGAPETIEAISSFQDPWSVNTAAQVAGVASLKDRDYCERSRSYIAEERERLAAGLAGFPWLKVYPSRANYLLAELTNGMPVAALRSRLMAKGILIRDCSNFQGLDERFFRVAVRLREENERLLAELKSITTEGHRGAQRKT